MQRTIEAGTFKRAAEGQVVELAYRYRKGMTIRYQARMSLRQRIDAGSMSTGTRHEDGDLRVTLKVLEKDETDGGFYVVIYHDPVSYRIDGVLQQTGPERLIYAKHDILGRIIESTDASGANVLLLPGEPINQGTEWREIQTFVPPQRTRPIDVIGTLAVSMVASPLTRIDYASKEVEYKGEVPGSLETTFRSSSQGWFDFDGEAGLLYALHIETTAHSEDNQAQFDMTSLFEMKLESIS